MHCELFVIRVNPSFNDAAAMCMYSLGFEDSVYFNNYTSTQRRTGQDRMEIGLEGQNMSQDTDGLSRSMYTTQDHHPIIESPVLEYCQPLRSHTSRGWLEGPRSLGVW